jgi:SAM-dependent methyltransferase
LLGTNATSRAQENNLKNYEPAMSFTEETFEIYEDGLRGDEDAAVAFLAELAGPGPALELAIGTGRIALPLAATGIRVDGIDISPSMVKRLRAKPGGDKIDITMGDFADVGVPGRYRLIYVVYNTMFNLLSQDDQVRCFENVAAHLTEDGSFVIEAGAPTELYGMRNNQYVEAEAIEVDHVRLDLLRIDPATQMLDENHVMLSRDGIKLMPVRQRYSWPSELDLMARIAGLRLKERWGYWDRRPYTANSRTVVSVYGR